jgi:two-component system OmpR family sensor kinase
MSERRWFRSLYGRIAIGFAVFLAVMLLAQGALFLWLAVQREGPLPPRELMRVADVVAEEIEGDVAREPGGDIDAFARARLVGLTRPGMVVFPDGHVVAEAGYEPAEPLLRYARERLAAELRGRPFARRFRGRGEAGVGARGPQADPERSAGALGFRGGPPVGYAPVLVDDRVRAAVVIAPLRPPGRVLAQFAPLVGLGVVLLLAGGTVLAARFIFRPAHERLRALEDATRRFGQGDFAARAPETGGDEIASVATAFNRMAADAAARDAARAGAERARRQLLADVSHELMTPLTAIRGYAETLTLDAFAPPTAPGRQAVHVIREEVARIEELVDDLLDLARYEAGGGDLQRDSVPVAALFARVEERHAPQAAERGVRLRATVAPDAELVSGDARRLEQVLQNLAANALRHTARGGDVSLSAERHGDEVVLGVRDTGSGIAPEHLPHVFERFYKADPSRADGGTGLGLSIVKAIIERHGGRVAVRSTPGVETVFEVRLPA